MIAEYLVKDLVGKPPEHHATEIAVVQRDAFRVLLYLAQALADGLQELIAESGTPGIVPVARLRQVALRFRQNQ